MYERYQLDVAAFLERDRSGPCFICQIVARHSDYPAHILYEDATAIVFLDKYPPEYGWTLVAPREHREQVTGDFSVDAYLALQRVVYWVSEAVHQGRRRTDLSLLVGAQPGQCTYALAVAPAPQGMPFHEQGPGIFRANRLHIPEEDLLALAARLRLCLKHSLTSDY
ncbi:MAG: HIT family protein [Chloroflexales bacterium]|nr:HIT family protein [Chloroflexales bacterium]